MIKDPVPAKHTGFSLFNYWYELYQTVTNKTLPALHKIPTQGKVCFNAKIMALKDMYGWEALDIRRLMLFALMHNPLSLDVADYGNVNNLIASAKHFKQWRERYRTMIDEQYDGAETMAIYRTMPMDPCGVSYYNEAIIEQVEAFDAKSFR